MNNATTIDEVLLQLNDIIAQCKTDRSPLGYFASLYRNVTAAVKQGIVEQKFQDNARMEKLDVVFANRFLAAYHAYRQNEICSGCWKKAFEAGKNGNLIVLQHLLGGINAHINMDLGLAAAAIAPGDEIFKLEQDFMHINDVLAVMSGKVQRQLGAVSWGMFLFSNISQNREKALINFSIDMSRKAAWAIALKYALLPQDSWINNLDDLDNTVSLLADGVFTPGRWSTFLIKVVRFTEQKDVKKIIEILEQVEPTA